MPARFPRDGIYLRSCRLVNLESKSHSLFSLLVCKFLVQPKAHLDYPSSITMTLDNLMDDMESKQKPPPVTSFQDLAIVESWDSETKKPMYVTFYLVTPDERVWLGRSFKSKRDITLAECSAALAPIRDDEIYPEIPPDHHLAIAPENLDDSSAFVKRPGLDSYEAMKGSEYIPKAVLDETLIMEHISQTPHPNIVRYHGCRVRRGRITALVLERLDQTLAQYLSTPDVRPLDTVPFVEALESAVRHLHALGLAHNDINPYNIMVKGGMPVLIDFGSCGRFGERLQSLGSEGWFEEEFSTSEKKHDAFALRKLREWIRKPVLQSTGGGLLLCA